MTEERISIRHLYKVFGSDPARAMALLNQNVSKEEIFARTGNAVGVCDVSFSINEGEIFVVMGLSGSGKSTLVRLLNRLVEPTSGSVFFDGVDIAKLSKNDLIELRRRKMSMVFQSFALLPHMTVIENVAFGLELSGIKTAPRQARAMEALERVNLGAFARSYPDELSGGMQQRVGLARALANDPAVMLMDEAFSALDPLIRSEMQDELLSIQRERKRTIVFISHDLNEAMRIGDRIAVMQGGAVVQIGTPDDIINQPANDYVRSFFRGVDVSKVFTAADIADRTPALTLSPDGADLNALLQRMASEHMDYAYLVGSDKQYHGVVSQDSLRNALQTTGSSNISAAYLEGVNRVSSIRLLSQVVGAVARSPHPLPIVDGNNRYLGVISQAALLECFDRQEGASHG